jgi:hypothetical protein
LIFINTELVVLFILTFINAEMAVLRMRNSGLALIIKPKIVDSTCNANVDMPSPEPVTDYRVERKKMEANNLFSAATNAVMELDLTPIKKKLMHVESGEGWSLEKANAVEKEYRRFLCLMKLFPEEDTAPLVDVDTFWHYHILDTMKYAADCEKVFGYFLHHYPYVGMDGTEEDEQFRLDSGERMRTLYESIFGEAYPGSIDEPVQIASAGQANMTAWCASPGKANMTAWCASPGKANTTAWCASPGKANMTAWCASPGKANMTAWCASPGKANTAAWCASPGKANMTAWCASPHKLARGSAASAANLQPLRAN